MIITANEKPVCRFGDDDIDRQYTCFNIHYAVNKGIRRLIYRQEYISRRERKMTSVYHDNIYIPPDPKDIQLIALQKALLKLRNQHRNKFKIIIGFYYGNCKTIKAYAEKFGISRQAMSKKLHDSLDILRSICLEEIKYLEN